MISKSHIAFIALFFVVIVALTANKFYKPQPDQIYFRYNQVGYSPNESKRVIVFSNEAITRKATIRKVEHEKVPLKIALESSDKPGWIKFSYYYELDISALHDPGEYIINIGDVTSDTIKINSSPYQGYPDKLLEFMRQQRCGYNPFLDMVCHQLDGRTFDAPAPDSTFIDVSGGWHDAGDQLKYLITSSFATGAMLMAYEENPTKFEDLTNALGQPHSNGIPDILDEAKWGLDWIQKMHPEPGMLFHQIADDRDHMGWKWPNKDNSDYGWGKNSYRPVYFATGKPQGLGQYKSEATGIANLAGRSAAVLAQASRIWQKDIKDTLYSKRCLEAAIDLYKMGRKQEGYQQGNSYGAPYRYNEITWADDMEWAAAELYRCTGKARYLEEAKHYARKINTTSWMVLDSAAHYEYYPFINFGHYALYQVVENQFKDTLATYYRQGIEKIAERAANNLYSVGVPFIWCSNNLVTALITQIILYENMTGNRQYHELMIAHRDWLFGVNPWGTSMFTGLPEYGEYPLDVHTSVWYLTKEMVPGGLVDGPIWKTIHRELQGLSLTESDEFSIFQNDHLVYHDDIGDYATNEPTMDGTAGAIFMMAYFSN